MTTKFEILVKRTINFFHASSPSAACMSPLWTGISSVYHKPLIQALLARDVNKSEHELSHFAVTGGSHGAERGSELYFSPDNTIDREKLSNSSLNIPDLESGQIGMAGVWQVANDGSTTQFSFPAWIVLRARSILGRMPENVLEIGPGLGFNGVIFDRWGTKSYSLIDIPSMASAAGFFLGRCCGENRMWFYGENPDTSKFGYIYPSTDCRGVLAKRYDIVLNVNSFPEIPNFAQDEYLEIISRCLAPNGLFLSINHENPICNQRSVALAMQCQSNLKRLSRKPSEILAGYFDEVYALNNFV